MPVGARPPHFTDHDDRDDHDVKTPEEYARIHSLIRNRVANIDTTVWMRHPPTTPDDDTHTAA